MAKKLSQEEIYVAPQITGVLDANGAPTVYDKKTKKQLDPYTVDDKIAIYERQVNGWFLNPASLLCRNSSNGFLVLMICLSYLEGVEQYKKGQSSKYQSRAFFKAALEKIYPNAHTYAEELYTEARCGLFHNGMTDGKILIHYEYREAITYDVERIRINPKLFLNDIRKDFEDYLKELETDKTLRHNFEQMFSVL